MQTAEREPSLVISSCGTSGPSLLALAVAIISPFSSCSSLLQSSLEEANVDRNGSCWARCELAEMVWFVHT